MTSRIVVSNRVSIWSRSVTPDVEDAIRGKFEHHNSKREALRRMGLPHWGEPAIIRTWVNDPDGGWLRVPRGGLERVREVLREAGMGWDIEDCRSEGKGTTKLTHKKTLWPHQGDALEQILRKQQGIVRAPTGSGKTTIGFAAVAALKLPSLVIVNGRALLDQWVARAEAELGIKTKDLGLIRGSKRVVKPLTIAMQPALAYHGVDEELAQTFGLILADEVQMFSAKTFFAVVDPFKAKYRIGISADNTRKDKKEFLTYDLFGPVIADVDRAELEDQGKIVDVEVRVIPTTFEADWYGLPDEDNEKELDSQRLLEEMAADSERNLLAVNAAQQEIGAGEQVLLMARHRAHCQELDQQLNARGVHAGILIGGPDYRSEFVKAREGIERGTLRAGIGTLQAIGQGIDLPRVAVAVIVTPIASNRQVFGQVRGRVCRAAEGKTGARLYYLWDHKVHPGHLRNLVRWNRTVRVKEGLEWVDAREWMKRAA